MIIGVPKEVKQDENRVSIIPKGVQELVESGHHVIVEHEAGSGIGISDSQYSDAGAEIAMNKEEVYKKAEMIVKVKEPIKQEFSLLQTDQIIFTFLHLAANKELTKILLQKNIVAIAYETVECEDGTLPLLSPMSAIAGRLATQISASFLQSNRGGKGVLMGGIPDVKPSNIMIIGGGMVGKNAAEVAIGMGGKVTILEKSAQRCRFLSSYFKDKITVVKSTQPAIKNCITQADVLIGAVLTPGRKAPVLVTEEMIQSMEKGSVVLDVAIDQGGIIETIKPTTHQNPSYMVDGIIHYGVTNIPGIVPRTSTIALTNKTISYIKKIADLGWKKSVETDRTLECGINVALGEIKYQPVAESLNL